MAKIHIENGIISSSADYSLYHGTSPLATVEPGGLRVQGDIIAENMIVSSSTTYMTTSFSAGSTAFGDTQDDTHQFTGSLNVTGSIVARPGDSDLTDNGALGLWVKGLNGGIKIGRHSGNDGAYTHLYTDIASTDFLYVKNNGGDDGGIATDKIAASTINPVNNYIHFDGYDKKFYGYNQGSKIYEQHDADGISIMLPSNDIFKVSGSLIKFTPTSTVEVTGSLSVNGSTNFNGRTNFRPTVINNTEGAFWIDPSYADGSLSSARIYVDSNNQLVFSRAGNDNLFIGTDGSVSGSAQTTGSFGMVHTEGIKGLDGTYDGTLLIPGVLAFGNDTDSMLRRRTSNDVEFRMAGTDIVRINTSGLQVENGSLEVESGNVIASGNISGSLTSTGSFGTVATNVIQNTNPAVSRTVLFKDVLRLATNTPGNSIGISAVGHGSGDYYIDFYNYQGGDPYIRLQTSSGQGRPYINLKNASYKGLTFSLGSGYNAEAFSLASGSNSDTFNSDKDTVFRVESKIHGESPTDTKMRSGRDIKFFGDIRKHDENSQVFFSVESNFGEKIISGSAQSTGSFGELEVKSPSATLKITSNELNNSSAGPFQSEIVNSATATYQQKMTDATYGTRLDGTSIIQFGNGASTTIRQAGGSGGTRNMTIDATEGSVILQTASTERLRITDTLISGSAASTGSFGRVESRTSNVSSDATIGGDLYLSKGTPKIYLDSDKDSYLSVHGDDEYAFYSGGTNRLQISNGGIGIASNNLTVAGYTSANYFRAYTMNENTIIRGNNTGIDVDIQDVGGTSIAYFEASAMSVGIGTTSPGNKLEVHGDAYITGSISGSATSTGSFARVETNNLQVPSSGKIGFYSDYQDSSLARLNLSSLYLMNGSGETKIRQSSGAGTMAFQIGTGTIMTTSATGLALTDTKQFSTDTFVSGILGDGFRISDGGSSGVSMEIDNIFVRNTLRTHIFQKDVVKATNGILIVSDSGVISGSSHTGTNSGTVTFVDDKSATFSAGDRVWYKDIDEDDGAIKSVQFRITASGIAAGTGFTKYGVDSVSGSLGDLSGSVGGTAVRISGGSLTLDASSANSPFMDVNAGSGSAKTVSRLGNLAGITSPRFGTLSGFGIWASGSAYFEGNVNATAGNIGGWGIGGNAISSSGGIISIDANLRRITVNDGSADRIYLGEVDGNGSTLPGSPKYGLKIFDGTGTADGDRLVELGEGANMIVGWELTPGRFQYNDPGGSIALDAGEQQVSVFTGSINTAQPKVVMGKLPRVGGSSSDDRYGFAVFAGDSNADITDDQTYNVLITRDKARLAGWDLIPGNIQSDNSFGSVRLSSISQSLTIWTGSINEAQPKLVLGKLPLHDGVVDSPYGLAVFSGSIGETVSGSEENASVLITPNKARLAGWELIPGRLSSGTVADINGNNASIALGGGSGGTNALNAGATPTSNLFFVSASSNPIFYVGQNFSYVNDVLTAAGWTIDTNAITKLNSDGGIKIDSSNKQIIVYSDNGSTERVILGDTDGADSFGIKGKYLGQTIFVLGEEGNEIAGWTITQTQLSSGNTVLNSVGGGSLKLGTTAAPTDSARTTKGVFISGSGDFLFKSGNTAGSNYIQGTGNVLIVSMSNFNVDAQGDVSMSGNITAAGGQIATFSITSGSIDSNTSNTKRGVKLEPGKSIRGYGTKAHSTTTVQGKFNFVDGVTIAPPAGSSIKWSTNLTSAPTETVRTE